MLSAGAEESTVHFLPSARRRHGPLTSGVVFICSQHYLDSASHEKEEEDLKVGEEQVGRVWKQWQRGLG